MSWLYWNRFVQRLVQLVYLQHAFSIITIVCACNVRDCLVNTYLHIKQLYSFADVTFRVDEASLLPVYLCSVAAAAVASSEHPLHSLLTSRRYW